MSLSIIIVVVIIAAILFFVYLKKTQKSELEGTFNRVNSFNRKQLKEMCDDLRCYAVWAEDSPKERVPLEICNKYGCSNFTYSDAKRLYEAACKRHNYLLEKEKNIEK